MAYDKSQRVQGYWSDWLKQSLAHAEERLSLCCDSWPSRPGESQHPWEPARVVANYFSSRESQSGGEFSESGERIIDGCEGGGDADLSDTEDSEWGTGGDEWEDQTERSPRNDEPTGGGAADLENSDNQRLQEHGRSEPSLSVRPSGGENGKAVAGLENAGGDRDGQPSGDALHEGGTASQTWGESLSDDSIWGTCPPEPDDQSAGGNGQEGGGIVWNTSSQRPCGGITDDSREQAEVSGEGSGETDPTGRELADPSKQGLERTEPEPELPEGRSNRQGEGVGDPTGIRPCLNPTAPGGVERGGETGGLLQPPRASGGELGDPECNGSSGNKNHGRRNKDRNRSKAGKDTPVEPPRASRPEDGGDIQRAIVVNSEGRGNGQQPPEQHGGNSSGRPSEEGGVANSSNSTGTAGTERPRWQEGADPSGSSERTSLADTGCVRPPGTELQPAGIEQPSEDRALGDSTGEGLPFSGGKPREIQQPGTEQQPQRSDQGSGRELADDLCSRNNRGACGAGGGECCQREDGSHHGERGECEAECEVGGDITRYPSWVDLSRNTGLDHQELAEIYLWMERATNRTDELRLLGNGVVPASCERAVLVLMKELSERPV